MIYNLYIFNKFGILLYYGEWNRIKQSGLPRLEEAKLMYGMLISIKSFVNKISPTDVKEGFHNYKTNKYALHYLETPSGLRFIVNTDVNAPNVKEFLQQFYSKIYVEYAVRNPLWNPGTPITSDLFIVKCDEFVRKSSIFGYKSL